MAAVRTLWLAALAAGCTSTLTTEFPGGTLTARPQQPSQPPAPVMPVGGTAPEPAAATPTDATPQIKVVALVGTDAVITDDEVWQMVRHRVADYARLDSDARTAKETEVFREELRKLVERELVITELMAKLKKNKPQLVDELKEEAARGASKQLRDIRKSMGNPTDAQFEAILAAQRLTLKGITRQFERAALKDMYLGQMLREKKRDVSLAEVRGYYDDHPAEFASEDRVKWLDLFLAADRFASPDACRVTAADLARQARGGADFVALVRQHGHGDSRLRDGEGVGAKPGEIRPVDVEAGLFATAAGAVSDPIPTATGYHVVKVLEREYAGTKPFDAATQAAIRGKLVQQFREAEVGRLIDDLWRKTTVQFVGLP